MKEFHVYEGILEGLKEALAYQNGDRSHCRVSVREKDFSCTPLTNVSTFDTIVDTKGGEQMAPKGRPTDDPKTLSTRIRLSELDTQRLEFCAQAMGMKKSEIIRMGIREVYERLKKE